MRILAILLAILLPVAVAAVVLWGRQLSHPVWLLAWAVPVTTALTWPLHHFLRRFSTLEDRWLALCLAFVYHLPVVAALLLMANRLPVRETVIRMEVMDRFPVARGTGNPARIFLWTGRDILRTDREAGDPVYLCQAGDSVDVVYGGFLPGLETILHVRRP